MKPIYDQQCDVSFKPKHLRFQALHVTIDDKPFLCQIHKDLEIDPFIISIKS